MGLDWVSFRRTYLVPVQVWLDIPGARGSKQYAVLEYRQTSVVIWKFQILFHSTSNFQLCLDIQVNNFSYRQGIPKKTVRFFFSIECFKFHMLCCQLHVTLACTLSKRGKWGSGLQPLIGVASKSTNYRVICTKHAMKTIATLNQRQISELNSRLGQDITFQNCKSM